MNPKRILFIDDDEFIRKIYSDRLKASGFDLDLASTGKQAKEFMDRQTYALVCLDYMLPDESGLDVLNWIRKDKKLTTPVIVFTASGHEHKIEEFMEAGATEYVQKDHVVPTEFVEKINSLVK